MKPIAVLGTGPAGMMASYAVGLVGKPLAVFGLGNKSRIGGAQFLHRPLPDLNDPTPDMTITYRVTGDAETYQRKVYGPMPVPFVSFSGVKDGQTQDAWRLRETYDWLWGMFGANANQAMVDHEWLEREASNFRAIISAIPASYLCHDPRHTFKSVDVHIAEMSMMEGTNEDVVVYDGTEDKSWYRSSLINGVPGTEWGDSLRRNNPFKTVQVRKPVSTNCDCHPEVIRAGRYGTWKKGVLTHDAFFNTIKELNERDIIHLGPKQPKGDHLKRGYL